MAQVGCAGILVADMFCGPMPGLPGQGELVMCDAMPSSVGGCAANVAIDVARQGISVEVAGCVGDDAAAQVVLDGMSTNGIGCERIVTVPGTETSKTVILLVEGEDRRYVHMFGANAAFTSAHLDPDWIDGLDVFYVGGLFLMPAFTVDECLAALRRCRERNVVTVVDVVLGREADVADAAARLMPYVDYFLPNDDEGLLFTGKSEAVAQALAMRDMGAGTVVVTCGEAGAVAVQGDVVWNVPVHQVAVLDPSGAGDAFASGIITGIARGWPLKRTLAYGAALGASATRAVGTTTGVFTAAEAEAFVAENPLALQPGQA